MCTECARCGELTSARMDGRPAFCQKCVRWKNRVLKQDTLEQTRQGMCDELTRVRWEKAKKEIELFHLESLEKALVNQIWSVNVRIREERLEVR